MFDSTFLVQTNRDHPISSLFSFDSLGRGSATFIFIFRSLRSADSARIATGRDTSVILVVELQVHDERFINSQTWSPCFGQCERNIVDKERTRRE